MELFQIISLNLVVFLTYMVTGSTVLASVYDLCGAGKSISSSNGRIFFNYSSLGPEGNNSTCEKIIYLSTQDRVKLTMTKMSINNDVLEVFDGPFGGEKITPRDLNGQKLYESTGNTLRIVLKLQKNSSSSVSSSLQGTFAAIPFLATCQCAGIQNGYSKCHEDQSEKKCFFRCKENFVDLFNTTGNHTCNLLNGKWNVAEYKSGKFGCVSVALVPEINTLVNFTLSKSVCDSINNRTILELFRSHLFLPQKEIFQNGVCLKKNYSKCFVFNCIDKGNKSFVSVTIQDKAISDENQQTVHSERLNNAYDFNKTAITEIALALIKHLNDSQISANDTKPIQKTLNCPNETSLIDLPSKQGHTCTKCPQGTLYKSDERTCNMCPSGNSSSIECRSQAGSENDSPESTCKITCIPGKGFDTRSGFCQWCPYNTYQNSSEAINPVCMNCTVPRKTLYPGTGSPDDCHDPCEKGAFFDKSSKSCLACPLGTYQDDINHLWGQCKKCKNGMVTYNSGKKNQSDCVPSCAKGHFFDGKIKNCSKCGIGKYQSKDRQLACLQCPNGTSTQFEATTNILACIKTCPNGTYFNAKNTSCLSCPLGTYMDGDDHLLLVCKKCPADKTTYVMGASGGAECLDTCKAGKYLNSRLSVCKNCSIANYQNKENQLNCIQCPNGTSTQVEGSGTLSDCIKTCPNGTYFNAKNTSCLSCPLGTYMDVDDHLLLVCKKCPADKTTYVMGASGGAECLDTCKAGKYLNSRLSVCKNCSIANYQNKENQLNCIQCPNGTSTQVEGSGTLSDCIKTCPNSTYFNAKNTSCLSCPLGTYMDGDDHLLLVCKKCPADKTTYVMGASGVAECLYTCKAGKYLNSRLSVCKNCSIANYQNKENQLNCIQCPNGTSTQVEGSGTLSDCIKTCPNGTYFNAKNTSCLSCPLGTYMDVDDHLLLVCKKCPADKTTYVMGASGGAECLYTCKAGKYFNSRLSACKNCSIANYQNKENQLNCIQCPNGTSTQVEGSGTLSDCIKTCPNGTYFNAKNTSCLSCPFGTYMDGNDHFLLVCKKCPADKTTYVKGVSDEAQCAEICKVGHYFNSSMSCQVCPQGTFQTKRQQQHCMACPPGLNTKRSGATSNLECIKFMCNQGEYIDPQNGDCHLCENGTHQSAVNHTTTACKSCLSGKTNGKGSKDESACVKMCDLFPCENGADCSETNEEFSCKCPEGVTGKLCDVIEKKEKLQAVQVSIRFVSLTWSNDLSDPSSAAFKKVSYTIEKELVNSDEEIIGAKVRRLSSGSVIADVDLLTNSSASLVPAKSLQAAVAKGSIGGLPVDTEYLSIRQITCSLPLGMENGRIQDEQITASSSDDNFVGKGRLNDKAWYALKRVPMHAGEYLQVRFHGNVNVTAIATQGDDDGAFVKAFSISYSGDGDSWTYSNHHDRDQIYRANSTSVFKQVLEQPITSVKYIRFIPLKWQKAVSMRIELYGCISDPVLRAHTEKKPEVIEPNVQGSKGKKDDNDWGKYLGIAFGLLMLVVVVVSGFFWWRSSKRRKQKETTPLMLTRFQDGSYREMEKSPNDEEEDAV